MFWYGSCNTGPVLFLDVFELLTVIFLNDMLANHLSRRHTNFWTSDRIELRYYSLSIPVQLPISIIAVLHCPIQIIYFSHFFEKFMNNLVRTVSAFNQGNVIMAHHRSFKTH